MGITKGEFTHSNPRKPGHLTEKRIHYQDIDRRRQKLIEKLNQKIETTNRTKLLSEKIRSTKQNIRYLNNIIKEKRENINKSRAETDKLKLENAKRTLRLPQFGSKVGKIEQVTKQHLVGLEQHRLKVNHKLKALSNKRKEYLQELSTFIFPIEFVEIQQEVKN